jgi:hypothetical protein
MNALLVLERMCAFRSSKDSVKAISDDIDSIFWSYTKVPLLASAHPFSKCFRGL